MTDKSINTLLVITTEAVIEDLIVKDVLHLGASGYTIVEAHGKGDRGARSCEMFSTSNIRMEIAGSYELVKTIKEHIAKNYANNYATFMFMHSIEV